MAKYPKPKDPFLRNPDDPTDVRYKNGGLVLTALLIVGALTIVGVFVAAYFTVTAFTGI